MGAISGRRIFGASRPRMTPVSVGICRQSKPRAAFTYRVRSAFRMKVVKYWAMPTKVLVLLRITRLPSTTMAVNTSSVVPSPSTSAAVRPPQVPMMQFFSSRVLPRTLSSVAEARWFLSMSLAHFASFSSCSRLSHTGRPSQARPSYTPPEARTGEPSIW